MQRGQVSDRRKGKERNQRDPEMIRGEVKKTAVAMTPDMKKKMSVFSTCLHLSEWEGMRPLELISI